MNEQLLPRIYAADRLCASLQRLKQENHQLAENVASLEQQSLLDSLTGLGNARYLHQQLAASLRQVESRGTALCYLQIGLPDAGVLNERYGEAGYAEILRAIAGRLQQLVRPLDVVCRIDEKQFGLLALIDDLKGCSPSSFKRLHEGLNLRALKTSEARLDQGRHQPGQPRRRSAAGDAPGHHRTCGNPAAQRLQHRAYRSAAPEAAGLRR